MGTCCNHTKTRHLIPALQYASDSAQVGANTESLPEHHAELLWRVQLQLKALHEVLQQHVRTLLLHPAHQRPLRSQPKHISNVSHPITMMTTLSDSTLEMTRPLTCTAVLNKRGPALCRKAC